MKAQELRTMTVEELRSMESTLRRNLFQLRAQARTKELKNHAQIEATRRDLARVKTILTEKGHKA
ncbi:MAG: 50S ribosomal protein L29 [Candidatus Sumerlaeia bacterium]